LGTVGELCDKWWTYTSPNLAPAVAVEYRRLLDKRILPALGPLKLHVVHTKDLDAWYAELLTAGGGWRALGQFGAESPLGAPPGV
jgi:hypothetical protein